mgnify:CR=1 FL=1
MFNVKQIPGWLSVVITIVFVWSNVLTSLVVTDLGEVLHMIGGTAASFMIFFLPGLLLMNGAIIKHTYSCTSLSALVSRAVRYSCIHHAVTCACCTCNLQPRELAIPLQLSIPCQVVCCL